MYETALDQFITVYRSRLKAVAPAHPYFSSEAIAERFWQHLAEQYGMHVVGAACSEEHFVKAVERILKKHVRLNDHNIDRLCAAYRDKAPVHSAVVPTNVRDTHAVRSLLSDFNSIGQTGK